MLETSELQRQAFNRAFSQAGLDWYWNVATYCRLLKVVGGLNRVRHHAITPLPESTLQQIHRDKERHFADLLAGGAEPRPGVVELIRAAQDRSMKVVWATTTSRANVTSVFSAMAGQLGPKDFDFIFTAEDVSSPKPDPAIFNRALADLELSAQEVLAVEDTPENLKAAASTGMPCVFFPGEYAEASAGLKPAYRLRAELLD